MSVTRQDVLDAASAAFSGQSLTSALSQRQLEDSVNALVLAVDDFHYTVNPSSPVHPSQPR
jgi:hypothetical protein